LFGQGTDLALNSVVDWWNNEKRRGRAVSFPNNSLNERQEMLIGLCSSGKKWSGAWEKKELITEEDSGMSITFVGAICAVNYSVADLGAADATRLSARTSKFQRRALWKNSIHNMNILTEAQTDEWKKCTAHHTGGNRCTFPLNWNALWMFRSSNTSSFNFNQIILIGYCFSEMAIWYFHLKFRELAERHKATGNWPGSPLPNV
jgi:hypothetical protein